MTALIDVLFQIEKQLGLELDSLLPYAEADNIGGFHPDPTQRQWGMGAIFGVEGQTLYALIRALKPETLVEIGSGTGCSATHIAAALSANGRGHLTTVDRGNTPQIPADLLDYVTIHAGDGINYLALLPDSSVDFILEDADHTADMCHAIGELVKTKLKPGGVLLVHDIAHWGVGADIRRGYDLAGMEVRRYLIEPSDCGWGVWQRAKAERSIVDQIKYAHDYLVEQAQTVGLGDPYVVDLPGSPALQVDARPVIDFTVLQGQEEPNATYQNPSKFQPNMVVKVINPESKYFDQTGQVYSNYRSGSEPQAYGVRFKDGAEFWVRETELEGAGKPTPGKRTRKPKAAK
jgi:predicted O-methyltransferase YrrM